MSVIGRPVKASLSHQADSVISSREGLPKKHFDARMMVGSCPAIREICQYILKVGSVDCNVLITGETGTGKELVAKAIHQNSHRANRPFIAINCAALPDALIESELFGYEKGAFTGATGLTPGKLESANGGTVLLDEIGDMTLLGQAKILRVIEEGALQRLGGKQNIPLDVRYIAATNYDLEKAIFTEKFRKDLFFRFDVGRIHLPPLRGRPMDIPVLIDFFIQQFNKKMCKSVEGINQEALSQLIQYEWPGNIRELKNLIEGTFINGPGKNLSINDFPLSFRKRLDLLNETTVKERNHLLAVLEATKWNRGKAAKKLKWSRMTLYRKMIKYKIHTKDKTLKKGDCLEFQDNFEQNIKISVTKV